MKKTCDDTFMTFMCNRKRGHKSDKHREKWYGNDGSRDYDTVVTWKRTYKESADAER